MTGAFAPEWSASTTRTKSLVATWGRLPSSQRFWPRFACVRTVMLMQSAMWTYPWTADLEQSMAGLADRGIDGVAVAGHYHSVRSFDPRINRFSAYPGGCWFEPGERFEDLAITPPVNDLDGVADPFAAAAAVAADQGLDVAAWQVCLHNSRLGATNPDFRQEDAFGNPHDNALCPSNPEVGAYFAAVAGALADRGASEVQLESVGVQSVLHHHGPSWGHAKQQAFDSPTETWLLSQCFCEACRERAGDHAVDVDAAAATVRELLAASLSRPERSPPSLASLTMERPELRRLFDFRAEVVTSFVETVAAGAGDAPLSYYAMDGEGVDPDALWRGGVSLSRLEPHLDRLVCFCYTDDSGVARERLRTFTRATDLPVDAGVTLAPDRAPDEETLHAVVDACRAEAERVQLYHHTLATEAQLDWVGRALA